MKESEETFDRKNKSQFSFIGSNNSLCEDTTKSWSTSLSDCFKRVLTIRSFNYSVAESDANEISLPHPNYSISADSKNSFRTFQQEKLIIKVKQCEKWYDEENKVPCYRTRKDRIVLIVNIYGFDDDSLKERKGSKIDEENICNLFNEMGFKVYNPRRNEWSKKDIENEINYFKANINNNVDMSIVVFMSHGNGNTRSDSTVISCSNKGKKIETNWIVRQFDGKNCEELSGKPKMFIFQCCRGNLEFELKPQVDGHHKTNCGEKSDILIAYSTLPGFVSYRYEHSGTWYINSICKVFMEHACDTHVEDLLKMVESEMENFSDHLKQITCYENWGFKICYLHPKKINNIN